MGHEHKSGLHRINCNNCEAVIQEHKRKKIQRLPQKEAEKYTLYNTSIRF